MNNKLYKVRRNNVTSTGIYEKGDIVKVISIRSDIKMAEINNGYGNDTIMIKDLEVYNEKN